MNSGITKLLKKVQLEAVELILEVNPSVITSRRLT